MLQFIQDFDKIRFETKEISKKSKFLTMKVTLWDLQ